MDLSVVVDRDHSYHRPCLAVSSEEHRPGVNAAGGDGVGEGGPAEAVIVLRVQVGYEIEVFHLVTCLVSSAFMIRVHPAEMLAGEECRKPMIELIEHDSEVPWVSTGRFESQPGGAQRSHSDQGEHFEPDEWHVLGELVDGRVPCGEHRDPVIAVDVVIALGIGPQRHGVERAASDDDGRVIMEPVTFSDVSLLGHLWLTAAQPCRAWSRRRGDIRRARCAGAVRRVSRFLARPRR